MRTSWKVSTHNVNRFLFQQHNEYTTETHRKPSCEGFARRYPTVLVYLILQVQCLMLLCRYTLSCICIALNIVRNVPGRSDNGYYPATLHAAWPPLTFRFWQVEHVILPPVSNTCMFGSLYLVSLCTCCLSGAVKCTLAG